MLWYYYSPLNLYWNGIIDESSGQNSNWRGTIQTKSLVAISLHANRKTAITWPYKFLSTFDCHAYSIQIVYKQITWDKIGSGYRFLHTDDMVKQKMPTSSLCVKWVLIYIRKLFILKELFHKLFFLYNISLYPLAWE